MKNIEQREDAGQVQLKPSALDGQADEPQTDSDLGRLPGGFPVGVGEIELNLPLFTLLRAYFGLLLERLRSQRFSNKRLYAVSLPYSLIAGRADMTAAKRTHRGKPYSHRQLARHHRALERMHLARRERAGWGDWRVVINPHIAGDLARRVLSSGALARYTWWAEVRPARAAAAAAARRRAKGKPPGASSDKPAAGKQAGQVKLPADIDAEVFAELIAVCRELLTVLDGAESDALRAKKAELLRRLCPTATGPAVPKDIGLEAHRVWLLRGAGLQWIPLRV